MLQMSPSALSAHKQKITMKFLQVRLNSLFAGATFGLALGCIVALPARAVIVNVSGISYDVLASNRAYDVDPSLFNSSAMPWFTGNVLNSGLAYDFAQAVYDQLGSNSYSGFAGAGGPLFAYASSSPDVYAVFQDTFNLAVQNETQVSGSGTFSYAYVNVPAASTGVPAPLPVAGAALGFGWSRSLRSRLRSARR
jgi:hypothetical protein